MRLTYIMLCYSAGTTFSRKKKNKFCRRESRPPRVVPPRVASFESKKEEKLAGHRESRVVAEVAERQKPRPDDLFAASPLRPDDLRTWIYPLWSPFVRSANRHTLRTAARDPRRAFHRGVRPVRSGSVAWSRVATLSPRPPFLRRACGERRPANNLYIYIYICIQNILIYI